MVDPQGVVAQGVLVTLDGEPAQGVVVRQPGLPGTYLTDAHGMVTVPLDFDVTFEVWITASHPQARIGGRRVRVPIEEGLSIALSTYDPADNEAYDFHDPGTPFRRDSTDQCAHCHVTLNEDWHASVHAGSASNETVHDLYAGTAAIFSRLACERAGGRWAMGPLPGTDAQGASCYLGPGVVHDLDPRCDAPPCDAPVADPGGCADCHAPGIDGALGGRGLHEARGIAFEAGVHCDVCHKVEAVDLDEPPGVAGRLRLHRPSEPTTAPGLGDFLPLTFGPHHDVPNPRMGSVQREHFRQATLCAGCHEDVHAPRVPGVEVDRARWPSGALPIQTTYSEWREGPLGEGVPCQSCHMPPDPRVTNSADLQLFQVFEGEGSLASGWPRPPGAVRRHSFVGPRSADARMLELSAALELQGTVHDDQIVVQATARHVGPGHGLPTGEPMRHLVLRVAARCGERALRATGGTAIPDTGGALAIKGSEDDWERWSEAQVGHRVRVVQRPDHYLDYQGWGPFGDGTFSPEQRGLRVERVVGEVAILEVIDGVASFDGPLPEGDRAYLVDDEGWIEDGVEARAAAGGPGFAFARVTVDAHGNRHVAAHRAVDIASDNRLMPGGASTTTHHFALDDCVDPQIGAALTWRAYPVELARQKRWSNPERVLVQTWRSL